MSLYTGINTKKMKFYLPLSLVNMGKFAFNCKFSYLSKKNSSMKAFVQRQHCVKTVQIWSFFWSVFSLIQIGVLKISNYSQENFQTCNFIKKRHKHRFFPVNIVKFLRTLLNTEKHRSE